MPLTVRPATEGDLDLMVALTSANRHRLAQWAPRWWRVSAAADETHAAWLRYLVRGAGPVVRLAEEAGAVVGCAVSVPQPGRWSIDDVAVSNDDRWDDVGVALLAAIPERPALTCVPTAHAARAGATTKAGLRCASSYWIRATEPGVTGPRRPLPGDLLVPDAPPHTFGGPLCPTAEGALAFADHDDGLVIGSPSITAPPVYDPGGTVCVVDRIVGRDRGSLLVTTLAAAAQRGDVLLNVVVATHDVELQDRLAGAGFARTVEVYVWPDGR